MAEISRRTLLSRTVVLAGLAVGAGLGFAKGVRHRVAEPPPAPPAALTQALGRQQRLLAGYLAVGSDPARPALAGLRADVTAHGDALRALLDRYPGWRLAVGGSPGFSASPGSTASASPGSTESSALPGSTASASPGSTASASPAATSVAGLAAASTADARALSDAVLAWPAAEQHAGDVVPVLASIAACLTSHAQVLA